MKLCKESHTQERFPKDPIGPINTRFRIHHMKEEPRILDINMEW